MSRQGRKRETHHPYQALEGPAEDFGMGGGEGDGKEKDEGIKHLQLLLTGRVKLVMF